MKNNHFLHALLIVTFQGAWSCAAQPQEDVQVDKAKLLGWENLAARRRRHRFGNFVLTVLAKSAEITLTDKLFQDE